MIAYLNGTIINKSEKSIILDVNNVGYAITINSLFLAELVEGDSLNLFIHTNVREDEISLYGFATLKELNLFKTLITVSGIGPKVGLEMLNLPLDKIKQAILTDNLSIITSVPGIGKKTAQRLILELKGKIDGPETDVELDSPLDIDQEIMDAIIGFGYQKHQVIKRLKNMPPEITKAEEIIRYFLQNA